MDDDRLRQALRDIASDAPRKYPAPNRLTTRARRRLTAVAGVSAVMTALIATGAWMAITRLGNPGVGNDVATKRNDPKADVASAAPNQQPRGALAVSGSDGTNSGLFVVDTRTRKVRSAVQSPLQEDSPSWSPDGKSIAFQRYLGQNPSSGDGIFVREPGGAVRMVADVGDTDAHPTWSPRGDQIAFDSTASGSIYVVGSDGSGVKRVTAGEFPAWSPDGAHIAFVRDRAIHIVTISNREVREVEGTDGAADVAWSPDGTRLVFSDYDGERGDLFTISAEGGTASRLTNDAKPDRTPAWSPTGDWIAFVEVVGNDARIHVVSSDGSRTWAITPAGRSFFEPEWRPQP